MRILVLGGDGYLGWPTAIYLSGKGHDVGVVDNSVRRQYDEELGSGSLVPIETLHNRVRAWREVSGKSISIHHGDLLDADFTYDVIRTFEPDAIVHFAEQRAAPYSMIDRKHAVYTQTNNVVGNLNVMFAIGEINRDIHLVKLGTMGEYGTPNIDIEEGWLEVTHNGRTDRMLYPRLATRFDYDAVFGTVLNRFSIQAVLGKPLSVYGGGTQTRAVIDIRDTVECIRLACETPADAGEFRVFNQATESFSLVEMAKTVQNTYPGQVDIEYVENPRVEVENHHYSFTHTALESLGLKPHLLSDTLLTSMFGIIEQYKDRVDVDALKPTINWRKTSSQLPGNRL
jgi:UDP-sulfoquinovose synthase